METNNNHRASILRISLGVFVTISVFLFRDNILSRISSSDSLTEKVIGTWSGEIHNEAVPGSPLIDAQRVEMYHAPIQKITILELDIFQECELNKICANFDLAAFDIISFDLEPLCAGNYRLIDIDENNNNLYFEAVNNSCQSIMMLEASLRYLSSIKIVFTTRVAEYGTTQSILGKESD